MAQISLYAGIDKATITPFPDHAPGPFTTIRLSTDHVEIAWLIDQNDLPAFVARLREIADAVETGERVTIGTDR